MLWIIQSADSITAPTIVYGDALRSHESLCMCAISAGTKCVSQKENICNTCIKSNMHKLIIKAPERQEQQHGWSHNSASPPPKWEELPTV